jgi:general secretion pathway protein J
MKQLSSTQGGFTLLEILISFSLIAVILVIMHGGIQLNLKISGKGQERIDANSQVRSVRTFLQKQLQGALALALAPSDNTDDNRTHYFKGSSDKMQFIGTMPGYLKRQGLYEKTLEIKTKNGVSTLVLSYTPVNLLDDSTLPEHVILLSGINDLQFEYRTRNNEDRLQPWEEEWDPTSTFLMPELIRIKLSFTQPDARLWPLFVSSPYQTITD